MREQDEQGTQHFVAAVVSGNPSEANSQISQKHFMLLGKFDRRENRRSSRSLNAFSVEKSRLTQYGWHSVHASGGVSGEAQSLQLAFTIARGVGLREQDKQGSTTIPPLRPERQWRERTKFTTALLLKILTGGKDVAHRVDETANAAFRSAFTMAEILLSLTIIGVVAAITLPSLTGNINERTWNTQRKALYARFSQAIALMPALNGYGTLSTDASGSVTADTAAETFVTDGLAKVLKINNICDSEHLEDCGIPSCIIPFNNAVELKLTSISTLGSFNPLFINAADNGCSHAQIDTKAAAFETQNGESVIVYYNPYCASDPNITTLHSWDFVQKNMCVNLVYDLNGSKGPNTVGKDIGFISALYPSDSVVVAPMPTRLKNSLSLKAAMRWCTSKDTNSRLPNKDEAASLFYNKNLIGDLPESIWSSSFVSSSSAWYLMPSSGARKLTDRLDGNEQFVCIKR